MIALIIYFKNMLYCFGVASLVGTFSNNSTSKMIFEFGGITFPAPRSPYPNANRINNSAYVAKRHT